LQIEYKPTMEYQYHQMPSPFRQLWYLSLQRALLLYEIPYVPLLRDLCTSRSVEEPLPVYLVPAEVWTPEKEFVQLMPSIQVEQPVLHVKLFLNSGY